MASFCILQSNSYQQKIFVENRYVHINITNHFSNILKVVFTVSRMNLNIWKFVMKQYSINISFSSAWFLDVFISIVAIKDTTPSREI